LLVPSSNILKSNRKAPAFFPYLDRGSARAGNLVRPELYPARESKISRLLEFEADVEKLRRTNSRLIAQIQRLETERNEVAQKLSKVGTSRSTREPD